MEDLIVALRIISGPDEHDPVLVPMALADPGLVNLKTLRVAFYTDNGILSPTSETVEAVKKAVGALSDVVAHVEEDVPEEIEQTYDIWWGLASADGGAGVKAVLKTAGTTEPDRYLKRFQEAQHAAKEMTRADFGALIWKWDTFCAAMTRSLRVTMLLFAPWWLFLRNVIVSYSKKTRTLASATALPTTLPDGRQWLFVEEPPRRVFLWGCR